MGEIDEGIGEQICMFYKSLKRGCSVMKCPLRIDAQGNASDCYKDECAWWVINAEIEGSKTKGACSVLEVATNGIFVTIGDDEVDFYE